MKYLLAISLILLYSTNGYCCKGISINTRINNNLTSVDTSRYAVFKFDQTKGYPFDKNCIPTTLSTKELVKMEKLINSAVLLNNKKSGKYYQISNPLKYYKQIIAVVNSKGEKEVWVNCFHYIADMDDWRKTVLRELDCGPFCFNLKINLTKNTFFDLFMESYG